MQVLVQTGKKNYTAQDALQLLKDLNLTQQASTCRVMQSICKAVSAACIGTCQNSDMLF